jgi:WD40 repeat protein
MTGRGGGDRAVKVWNVENGREARTLVGPTFWLMALALSGNGRRTVSA